MEQPEVELGLYKHVGIIPRNSYDRKPFLWIEVDKGTYKSEIYTGGGGQGTYQDTWRVLFCQHEQA
jgi:hypothetical protein